jgi:hypothetical protein
MKSLFSIALICLAATVSAQSFLDIKDKKDRSLYEDNWFNIMVRYTHVGGKYTEKLGGFTGNVSLRNAKVAKGKMSWYYENPTLGDLIWKVANIKRTSKEEQAFGSGFLGWLHGYYNVVSTDKLILAPGLSLGDYIFGSERDLGGATSTRYEPYGYYFAAGPAFKTSYLLNKDFWVDGTFNWDFALTKFKKGYSGAGYVQDDGYPNPMFVSLHVTLYHKSKFFLSVRGYQMIDLGKYNDSAQRWDVSVGYQLLH